MNSIRPMKPVLWIVGLVAVLASAASLAQTPPQQATAPATAAPKAPVKTGELRRVVTRLDASGKAVVMVDEKVALMATRSPNGVGEVWVTQKTPAEMS